MTLENVATAVRKHLQVGAVKISANRGRDVSANRGRAYLQIGAVNICRYRGREYLNTQILHYKRIFAYAMHNFYWSPHINFKMTKHVNDGSSAQCRCASPQGADPAGAPASREAHR